MSTRPSVVEKKLTLVLSGWENIAPTDSFAGMTLAQFKEAVKPSVEARKEIDRLDDLLTKMMEQRDQADVATAPKLQAVVAGVLADPKHGPNSGLYKAMGYVPTSEKKTGKTNKRKNPPPA